MATTDNIRVAIRVRPLIKRENDFNQQINWRVDGNTITQVVNGKIVSNSSYIFDRIFDTSNSTQDVYDEFGKPTVLSAMDGFNGTLFAYGQTSSGKTYTMMGDQQHEGVIPKAVGEIYDYIEKHPSREFLIRVSYMEIYNEDIRDLLNPSKTNLKVHENTQRQVYVGDLTEEVVSCGEDVFKHMMRGEKNRHFGETNMNDRSSRSHTIFRVVIESREMMDESKDRDAIDGAVRVAHLNLVDLAGSERASQTGAFGQRLKEGGHINKSLLALGSVIAKLSEGESFIPFRDSKLTRILQSSLGGNAKTSMICTITPAAIEESISTLKFASRAKTIKNCPEVNEVLDDGTLLKRYRKEIRELKKQLVEMSSSSHVQELQLEKEKVNEMEEMLEQQRRQQNEQEEKIKKLCNMICSAGRETETKPSKAKMAKRRETWCPGALLSKAPLASAAALVANSVQSRLQRISSSPSSEESEFDEMPRDAFLSTLEEEEERKSIEDGRRKVAFASPRAKRCLSPIIDKEQEDKEMQTEPDEKTIHMEHEVKKLRKDLHEAIQTRDFYNELLEESNALLEKMQTESGRGPAPKNLDTTLKYVAELRKKNTELETQVSVLKTQCQELENLKARNKVLEDEVQSLENERTLSNEYLSELQAEFDSVQAEKQALATRVEGLENTGAFNTATKMEVDTLKMALEKSEQAKGRLEENLETWKEKFSSLESDVALLQNELSSAAEEKLQFEERLSFAKEEASVQVQELEIQVKQMEERLSNVDEQDGMLTQVIEEKLQLEENKKVEFNSLQMALDESVGEKARLEETLQTWKEKIASLENDVARLQNELSSAVEEKLHFEERLSLAKEEASVKVQKLEIQVKQMEERLSNVDEQEGMLTQVIEEKLQLEESKKVEVNSLQMALEESVGEKARLEENLETWKGKYASLENDVARLQNEFSSAAEEKLQFEERLSFAKEEASLKVQELEIQVKQMEERLSNVDEQDGMLTHVMEEKLQLEENVERLKTELAQSKETYDDGNCNNEAFFEQFKAGKEAEISQLTKELEQLKEQRQTDSCVLGEKDVQQKRETDAKVSDLEVQLERIINEKMESEQTLERVKKERDEIKNDLSESITDNAELQKDMLDMQQKAKRYKEHIRELQCEFEQSVITIASHEQKIEELQNVLNQALGKIEQSARVLNDEATREEATEQDNLASLLSVEKERAEKIAEDCKSLKCSLETVESRNEVLQNEAKNLQGEVEELHVRIKDLESQSLESKKRCDVSNEQLKKEREKCEKLEEDLSEYKANECRSKDSAGSASFEAELQKAMKHSEELVKELSEERKLNETLRKEHSSLAEELQHLKDSLLRDTNRGMDQQRVIDKMKAERRETICVQAHQRQELEKDLLEAEKKVSELQSQCTLLKSEKDVLEHRLEVASKNVDETRQEMRDMENLYSSHNTRAVTQLDENKAVQKLKQMEFSIDLTKQKCEKAERRVKELENENRQLTGADIRNGALADERDNLKQQLQQAKQVLDEKSRKLSEMSIEVTQLKAHVDKLSEENKKHRCLIEKKDNKIDHLEQKLWGVEEELKLEKQRCQEQQSQGSVLEELNSTIQVKHEALEHMTFLVDEKDIEIAEVRSSLQENELKQLEMAEKSRRDEERLNDLENELSKVRKNLEEERNDRKEVDDKILELKGIIQRQESELIAINEKIELKNSENNTQSQELGSRNEKLENDLQDMEHKLLEVETELEFTKTSLDKIGAEKEDLENRARKALKEKELLEVKFRELQTTLEGKKAASDEEIDELRQSILNEKRLVSELEEKVLSAEKRKNAIEAELRRVQDENVSEHQIDEVKNSTTVNSENSLRQELEKQNEKNVQLESDVEKLTEEKSQLENLVQSSALALEEEKKRSEEEMARFAELYKELKTEKARNIELVSEVGKLTEENGKLESRAQSKTVIVEEEMARFAELCEELKKEKATNTELVSEVGKLTEENGRLESLTQSKTVIVEEEKKMLEEEMARLVGQFEEERTQLRQQLREISALKVKESEDCYSEKDDKIKNLEAKLAAATKNTADYKESVEHYQLKLAKVEYELDTTVARLAHLEKQNSTITTDNSQVESLKKECEAAKKKAKDTLEKYFSESDRLKAIIDEMQDEEEEFERQIDELKQSTAKKDAEISQLRTDLAKALQAQKKSVSSTDHSEVESLKKECEAAKKKAQDTLEKYFAESDRLKAIIDEQQEIIDKAQNVKGIEEEMEATRIELAQKNMQLQSLQYDLYKLQEKYDKEMKSLTKEVQWGREKVGSLKLEIRRLKEHEPEDTISIIRGQPVASKQKEDSDVGVVSNVAIYSLKAKVGKLEGETKKLSEKVQQLEREKATLSLLNTEASNKVTQLTSENRALKTHKKKLMEEVHKLKGSEDNSKLKNDSSRRLPEVPTETLEKESRNVSILSLSSTDNIGLPAAEHKRVKPEPKENFQNWLSEDASKNMFQDEPNQCANQ